MFTRYIFAVIILALASQSSWAQEGGLSDPDEVIFPSTVVHRKGWPIPKAVRSTGTPVSFKTIDGIKIKLTNLTPLSPIADYEHYTIYRSEIHVGKRRLKIAEMTSYAVQSRVFAIGVTYRPVDPKLGVANVFVLYLDRYGDPLFETRITSYALRDGLNFVPEWVKELSLDSPKGNRRIKH